MGDKMKIRDLRWKTVHKITLAERTYIDQGVDTDVTKTVSDIERCIKIWEDVISSMTKESKEEDKSE